MANPIPYRGYSEMATKMATDWKISNGYHFDVGNINTWLLESVSAWPWVRILIGDELNVDERRAVNNGLFNNEVEFNILVEYKNTGKPDVQNSVLECEKMVEDVKRFIGDHYNLADAGIFELFYRGHRKLYSNNATYPTGVNVRVLLRYRQYRSNPNQEG
jgi:hypothetical protein